MEISSHLWEAADAGVAHRAVVRATLRGMADDLTWACGELGRAAGRGLLSPAPYIVGSIIVVVQAAFAWNLAAPQVTHEAQGGSLLAAVALLLAAAGLAIRRRRRGP